MKRNVLFSAFLTLFVMGGVGAVLIPLARDIPLVVFLKGHSSLYYQVVIGLFSGMAIALIAWELVNISYLRRVKDFFKRIISDLKLNDVNIVFVSFCAGVGEELLFRGGIQPYTGILITSVIFVAIHGYLNPFNLRMSIYGIFMTLSIIYIGYLTERFGIVSSMVAHVVIDIYLLKKMSV